MESFFLGVMDLQEAKNHQFKLKSLGVDITFKVNPQTCTTGCKVTVEVWADDADAGILKTHFQNDYLKHVMGHEPNLDNLAQVFDPLATEVICQACGTTFSPTTNECPGCGLNY